MLTTSQIKWAASHDWFIGDNLDGTIMVRDAYTLGGALHEKTIVFSGGFADLRDWAGY